MGFNSWFKGLTFKKTCHVHVEQVWQQGIIVTECKNCAEKCPKIRPSLLGNGSLILHDNARPRLGKVVADLLSKYEWEVFLLLFYFQLSPAAFKAYCAIWVRRSNFRHQASPRVSPREST